MKEKTEKKIPLLFSFYDRTMIVNFLEKQAVEGWLPDGITSLGNWHFHRIEPKKIRFSVVYMKNASMFDPAGSAAQRTLADFCAHEGWNHAISNAQMQIFYSEDPDASPIVTDAEAELASIHETMKKTYLPMYWIWIFLSLFNISMMLLPFVFNPVEWLSTNVELLNIGCWLTILMIYGANLIGYARWRHRAMCAAALDGSFIRTHASRFFSVYSALLACVSLLCSLVFLIGSRGVILGACAVLLTIVGVSAILLLLDLFRRMKYSRRLNRILTVGLLILLTAGISAGILVLMAEEGRNRKSSEPAEIYISEVSGMRQFIYHDELPLTTADLTGTEHPNNSRRISRQGKSLLAVCLQASELARMDDPAHPELHYTVVSFRTPIGFRACRAVMLRDFTYRDPDFSAIETDAAPWGAEKAYQLKCCWEEAPRSEYLLCFDRTIVLISFDNNWEEEPTDAQRAIVGEKLGGYGLTK